MPVMTEDEIKDTVNSIRRILQTVTPYTSDAIKVSMLTAASFCLDSTKDREASAELMQLAFEPVVDGVRHGALEMRELNS